jgi:hypothetical protein
VYAAGAGAATAVALVRLNAAIRYPDAAFGYLNAAFECPDASFGYLNAAF